MKAQLSSILFSAMLMSESMTKEPWAKNVTPAIREFSETGEYGSFLWIILLAMTIIMFLVVFLLVICYEPKEEEEKEQDMEKAMDGEAMMDMMMSAP